MWTTIQEAREFDRSKELLVGRWEWTDGDKDKIEFKGDGTIIAIVTVNSEPDGSPEAKKGSKEVHKRHGSYEWVNKEQVRIAIASQFRPAHGGTGYEASTETFKLTITEHVLTMIQTDGQTRIANRLK
jgi:hypothetical protein